MNTASPITIEGLAQLVPDYDLFLLDQWGVLHNGHQPYKDVITCLEMLAQQHKQTIIVSNSSRRQALNFSRLDNLGFRRDLYTDVITSGEITWRLLKDKSKPFFQALGPNCFLIDREGEPPLLAGLDYRWVKTIETSDFLLLTGVPSQDWPQTLGPLLIEASHRNIPMVCANPDLISVGAGEKQFDAPGKIAEFYSHLGGQVRYIGKPYPDIYTNLETQGQRVLVIGDSLQHDIKGAVSQNWDSLLITGGIHRQDLENNSSLEDLAARYQAFPTYVLDSLRW